MLHALQNGEGSEPWASLAFGPDGRLYGTTLTADGIVGATAFAIDTLGNFDILHTFSYDEAPLIYAGLRWSSDGQLYGAGFTTGPFRLDPAGSVTPIPVDDPACMGTLIESDGSLYGTSTGSVYKITGSTSETLHTFAAPNGYDLEAGLLKAADGNFYGTTRWGGAYNGGTVFRMDPNGTVTTIHDFQFPNGTNPFSSLIQASDGFLYGTTGSGADGFFGTIYRLDYSGTGFSTVHAFSGPDGRNAYGSLIQAADGSLVGTAVEGGALNGGVVFRLTLPPAVLAVSGIAPSSGPASGGAAVAVAGGGFVTGATSKIGGAALSSPSVAGPTQLLGETPALAPGTLNDVVVTNPDLTSATLAGGFLADFLDVPASDIFHGAAESVFRHGITAGCGGGNYCRDQAVSRTQMAVFLVKAIAGSRLPAGAGDGNGFPRRSGRRLRGGLDRRLRHAGNHRRLRRRELLPERPCLARSDGRLPAEGSPDAGLSTALADGNPVLRRSDRRLRRRLDRGPGGARHHGRVRRWPLLPRLTEHARADGGLPAANLRATLAPSARLRPSSPPSPARTVRSPGELHSPQRGCAPRRRP